uniref:Uncharacterized protein n=1 Tax=Gorilla gorilla gorilla TaxID=9595 RepID=A0A2I2Y8I6_GORGO
VASRRPPALRLVPRQAPPLPQTTGAIRIPQAGPQLTRPTGRSSPQDREPLLRGQASERRPAPSTQARKAGRHPAIVPIGRCLAVECCLQTAPAPRGSARPRPVWAPEALRSGGGRGLGAALSIRLEIVALCFRAVELPGPLPPRGESKDLYGCGEGGSESFFFSCSTVWCALCVGRGVLGA